METRGQRIKRLRKAKNLSQKQLADMTNGKISQMLVSQWERDMAENPSLIRYILPVLDVSAEYLETGQDNAAKQNVIYNKSHNNDLRSDSPSYIIPLQLGAKDVPVRGNIKNAGGLMVLDLEGTPKEYVERLPSLIGVKDAFAVYVHDNLMSRKYEIGDTVCINPNRHPLEGQMCFVRYSNGTWSLRQFVRKTDTAYTFMYFNPKDTEEIRSLNDVRDVFKVAGIIYS